MLCGALKVMKTRRGGTLRRCLLYKAEGSETFAIVLLSNALFDVCM